MNINEDKNRQVSIETAVCALVIPWAVVVMLDVLVFALVTSLGLEGLQWVLGLMTAAMVCVVIVAAGVRLTVSWSWPMLKRAQR